MIKEVPAKKMVVSEEFVNLQLSKLDELIIENYSRFTALTTKEKKASKDFIYSFIEEIKCVAIIKQQPKIDEIYINEKARQLHEASWTGPRKKESWVIGIKEARSFISFIVGEILEFRKKG